ncbi:MAG: hypothetical protein EOO46_13300 [Flavobacterium sp.]|nr:MAG: hypothetical protein EOO46_13300 [Flavobacterium sp.]
MTYIKLFLISIVCLLALSVKGQNASVERSIFNIQAGTFGIWINNEAKLSNHIALKSELGLDAGIFGGSLYEKTGFLLTPVITLEPRWYYNINKRNSHSKNISGNSANFLSLKTSYNPDWFIISNADNLKVVNQISMIPTWGIRRVIGKHFNYEAGFGIGYRYIFAKSAGYLQDESEVAVNVHLRIGYKF